jgi:hypothetical protein
MKKVFAAIASAFGALFKTRLVSVNDPYKHLR